MHEWALAEGVVATSLKVAEKEGFTAIHRIVVKIGELQRINPEAFKTALDAVLPPADARLGSTTFELKTESVRFECRACERRFGAAETGSGLSKDQTEAIHFIPELAHTFLRCPQCHSPDFEVICGRGIWIESLEGE